MVLGALSGLVAFGITQKITRRDAQAAIPQMPEFRLAAVTEGIKLWANDAGITSKESEQQRLYRLQIKNVSKIPINHVVLRTQFPEPIIKFRSDASPEMLLSYTQVWDEPLIKVSSAMPTAKKFGEQTTGLWSIEVGKLPGATTLMVELVTSVDQNAEMYYGATGGRYKEGMQTTEGTAEPPYLWFLAGSYQFDKGPGSETKNFIVPLSYDRKHRTVTALPAIESGLNSTNWLEISFMPGVNLGHVQTMGSITIKPPGPILGNHNLKPTIFIEKIGAGHSSARSSAEDKSKK